MGTENHRLHFIMFPLMSPGHFIPMLDMAKLLAKRGAKTTIITAPVIAARFAPLIDRAKKSSLSIDLLTIRFPSSEAGLPEGCESFDLIPSRELVTPFLTAIIMLKEPFEQLVEEIKPKPSCIISDRYIPWVAESALKFKVPRIIFDGMSCFSSLSQHNLYATKAHESVDEWDTLVLPGLPDRIEIVRAHLLSQFTKALSRERKVFGEKVLEAAEQAYGVVINTFDELESKYIEELKKLKNRKVWCLGPLSLCNEDLDKEERGNRAAVDGNRCLEWLDEKEPASVVYVCLGSLSRLTVAQLVELGLGLEALNRPFVWVLRGGDQAEEIRKWIDEDAIEERTRGRGLIIRGWAPQLLILSHPAVGGFLTHCGWNSILEGICAGVPLITWPMFSDQFFNEKLVVEVLKIAVSIGSQQVMSIYREEPFEVTVKREKVMDVIERVVDGGVEGRERREKARVLGEKAKKAMEEEGGSTYVNMDLLIEDIKQLLSHNNGSNTL